MKRFLLVVLFLGIIGSALAFYLYRKPVESLADKKAEVQLSAVDLFTAFEQDENSANASYLGKIVEVSGKVQSVQEGDSSLITLTLQTNNDMFGIACQMDRRETAIAKSLKPGEVIQLKGICSGILLDVVLVQCVFAEKK